VIIEDLIIQCPIEAWIEDLFIEYLIAEEY